VTSTSRDLSRSSRISVPKVCSIAETALEMAGCDRARRCDALPMLPSSATVCSMCKAFSRSRRPMRSSHCINLYLEQGAVDPQF